MKYEIQEWKEKNMLPLLNNDVDMIIFNDTPTCQVEIYNFISKYYEVCPQDPLNQIFVSIVHDVKNSKENLQGDIELMWHIDGNYKKRPYNITGLYCVDIDERADTMFVDNRIVDMIPEYYDRYKDDVVKVAVKKFVEDDRYPEKLSQREKRMFRLIYSSSKHRLFQEDKRGKYIYYCNGNNVIQEPEYIDSILYDESRIYSHEWKPKQLVLYNNITTNHKRKANRSKKRHMWKVCGWNLS